MSDADDLARLLKRSEERAHAVLRASIDAVIIMDHHGRFMDFNPAAEAMFGFTRAQVLGQPVGDFIVPPPFRDAHRDGMSRYLQTGAAKVLNQLVEMPALRANGEEFPAEIAIISAAGEGDPIFVGFIRDITERKAAERRRELLVHELAHRGKNLLAVVQAIVRSTLRNSPPDVAEITLTRRLSALARSHGQLAADPAGASLRQIVEQELEAFSSRVDVDGPTLHLNARAAQTMALVVHELATNATKYGALSSPEGRVDIRWSTDDEDTFQFHWRERGGPPVVTPTRSGFGRVVLEQMTSSDFRTTPAMTFAPEGVAYVLAAPLERVAERGALEGDG